VVVDRQDAGRATDAGAGILAPAVSDWPDPALHRFALAAMDYYPQLVAQLAEEGHPEIGYAPARILVVSGPGDDPASFEAKRARLFERSRELVEEVSPSEARQAFPPLQDVSAALLSGAAARVDGRRLTAALTAAAAAAGVDMVEGDVTALEPRATAVRVRLSGGRQLDAAMVVVAAGAWSAALAEPLGHRLEVEPQRGQIVHLGVEAETAQWAIVEGFRGHYILPWPDGRIVCGATRETGSGFAAKLTAAGQAEVLNEALRLAPGLADAAVREWRVGLRPLARSGRPSVGPIDSSGRVFVAAGHGPNGLLLGPYSAYLLSQAVTGGRPVPELAPLLPA
jgi:D-amino-acid dehydrogenase